MVTDLAALDRLYEFLKEENEDEDDEDERDVFPPFTPTVPATNGAYHKHESPKSSVGKGEVKRAVMDIFNKSGDKEFTAMEVTDMVVAMGIKTGKPSVSGAIAKLVEGEFLEETVEGIGRKPGKFRKKS